MGVLGLVPFLLKAYPEVFQSLPHRLRTLEGKTLVIDGTLITQRLHFAPSPHPYRHVLGWYRTIKDLQDAGVRAICVFDGKERSSAKFAEVERRRETRRVTALRGQLESQRLKRLVTLTSHVGAWRTLDPESRQSTSRQLRELIQQSGPPTGQTPPTDLPKNVDSEQVDQRWDMSEKRKGYPAAREDAYGDFKETDLSEILFKYTEAMMEPATETSADFLLHSPPYGSSHDDARLPTTTVGVANNFLEQLSLEDTDPARMDESLELVEELPQDAVSVIVPSEEVPIDDAQSALITSYLEYRASVEKLGRLSETAVVEPPVPLPDSSEDGAEARTDYIMSKTQCQLTVDEGKFWEQLTDQPSPDNIETAVLALAEKSSLLSSSYERRTHPPTQETYDESLEILRAMSVPCIETNGPFEAEALGASLVLHGLADYVATEDTDVIVYGAPMIRNLTKRDAPLVVIDGEDVRATLELDRRRFIDFALLLGTDFSQRIRNVGPQRALKFIREHGTIEKVLENEPQYSPRVPSSIYLEQVAEARVTFETLPPTPDIELLQPSQYDEECAYKVLQRYGLGREVPIAEWNYSDALSGNYFQDNPSAS